MKALKTGLKTVLAVFFIVGLVGCADKEQGKTLELAENFARNSAIYGYGAASRGDSFEEMLIKYDAAIKITEAN
jgi:uncharacterized lipoprotein YehR (DUF1307 family)